jgi:hypothetical protein
MIISFKSQTTTVEDYPLLALASKTFYSRFAAEYFLERRIGFLIADEGLDVFFFRTGVRIDLFLSFETKFSNRFWNFSVN